MPDLRLSLPILRDAIFVAGIAVLTVQALRRWCGDAYQVPSGSMEPVLHGDEIHGDWVFVDKLTRAAACRRHDLVIVQSPGEPGEQLVKRIAARGDDADACWINIQSGDIWLGPNPQGLRRETKDPLAARTLRVPWAALPGPPDAEAMLDVQAAQASPSEPPTLAGWRLEPLARTTDEARTALAAPARRTRRFDPLARGLPAGCIGTAKPVNAGYLGATGLRGTVGNDVNVTDCSMEVDIREADAELLCTIDTHSETLTFHWQPTTGRVVLWRNGQDVKQATLPAQPSVHAPATLEFGWLDDRAFFVVDGRPEAMFVVAHDEWPHEAAAGAARTLLHVAVVGPQSATIDALRVYHDIFAWREKIAELPDHVGSWPRFVGPGMWFLLGDSAFDSKDSRKFDAVPSATFLGRPRFVLGPWPRGRWLPQ